MNFLLLSILVICFISVCAAAIYFYFSSKKEGICIKLPSPFKEGNISLEEAISLRRSSRDFDESFISLKTVSQILWAAQGVNDKGGFRTAPSAGATYPLEIYLIAGLVSGLDAGVYKFKIKLHQLEKVKVGDLRPELSSLCSSKISVFNASVSLIICGVYERTVWKYTDKGKMYVDMEVGSASENIYLQAVTLNLGTVFIGDFDEVGVKKLLNIQNEEVPLCIMPIGKVKIS